MKRRRRKPNVRLQALGGGLAAATLALLLLECLPPQVARPDPILLLTVAAAARWGRDWGGLTGFLGGLLLGWVSPGPVGGFALVYAGIGWVVGLARQETGQGNLLLLLLTAAATVACGLALSGLGTWLQGGPYLERVSAWLPGALIANLILIWPVRAALERP